MTAREGPLAGLRVIDMATIIAGPGVARHLADFGAEVVKVEPPTGDPVRRLGWRATPDDDSLYWKTVSRGKRCHTLDLKTDEGRAALLELVVEADVLVENLRPGKLEGLGLGPERLLSANPRLVIVRVSGFGQDGPYAERPGFASTAEAMGGLAAISGEPDGQPLLPPVALTDELTAVAGAFAAMTAVWEAGSSGLGQVVDCSLLDSLFHVLGPLPGACAALGYEQPRLGAGIPYSSPRGTYRCRDGEWVAVSTSSETVAARVLDLLGVAGDERFATSAGRLENRVELEAMMVDWVAKRPSAEVFETFHRIDAAIAPVYTMSEILADPHVRARGAMVENEGITMPNVIARLSRTPGRPGRPAGAASEEPPVWESGSASRQ